MENEYSWVKWLIGGSVALIVLLAILPFTIVDAGERAVVLRLGAVDRVLSEGMHWVTPFTESVKTIEVTTQKEQVKSTAASKDLQNVTTEVAVNYNLQPDKVGELWKTFKGEHKDVLIDPSIQEAIKAATANYTAEELVTKREVVREEIEKLLIARLEPSFIHVTGVSIVEFDFSKSFNEAIEAKVTAEQNALAAKNKLEQVKFEAEQRISQAKGEAEAIRIQSQAIQSQGGENYVQLKTIEKWNGVLPIQMIPGSAVPFVNLNK